MNIIKTLCTKINIALDTSINVQEITMAIVYWHM